MVGKIQHIKSKDNSKYKLIKSLLKAKYRNKEKKYIAEGLRTVQLAIEHGASINSIVMSEGFYTNNDNLSVIKTIMGNYSIYVLSDDLFKNISQTENSQGIIAVVDFVNCEINKISLCSYSKVLVLDRVCDPGNMGTIIRTADASGYDMIILTKGCVDIYNPKVVRSSMGSIFYMDIVVEEEEEIVKILKKNSFSIVSSYLDTDKYFDEIRYDEKTALVLGNEANGISDFWIKNSDILVKIPMFGKAESFNVAISSGILMYHISRNR